MDARPTAPLWIFGYGSLIFRPDFPFAARVVGRVAGVKRRFWQASEDHRGRPGAPGRVVTLVESPHEHCAGLAFLVAPGHEEEVLTRLGVRESGGYSLHQRAFEPVRPLDAGLERPRRVWIYVGTADNPMYVGPENEEDTARVIAQSEGPSGPNVEYLHELHEALEALGERDEHVTRLWRRVRAAETVGLSRRATQ